MVSKDMPVYTNHRKTTSAKRDGGRKSAWTERYHHILRIFCKKRKQNYCNTGDNRTEYTS
jgi:hypothetical protein